MKKTAKQIADNVIHKQHHSDLIKELKKILRKSNSPSNSVTIGASGVMGALNMRKINDLDISVTNSTFKKLKKLPEAKPGIATSGDKKLTFQTPKGEIEFFKDWNPSETLGNVKIKGINHWSPEKTLKWKESMRRPKDLPDIKKLKTYLKKTALQSQEEIYQDVYAKLPPGLRRGARFASGGLADARGISDVDIALYRKKHQGLLSKLPEGAVEVPRNERHTIYEIPGYDRPVSLYVTSVRGAVPEGHIQGVVHGNIGRELERQYPELALLARQYKASGLSTEEAWAKVLKITGDPYAEMLKRRSVMALAKKLQREVSSQNL